MASVNKVIILGNLGRDPEQRFMQSGEEVCNIAVATTDSWKDKSTGERKEHTEWHKIVAFRKLAEIMNKYLQKGSQVYIEGHLQTRKWTDKDGVERYSTEIVADTMQMVGKRPEGGRDRDDDDYGSAPPRQQRNSEPASSRPTQRPAPNFSDMDEDIPFDNPYKGRYSHAV